MKFENAAQENAYQKVGQWLREIFGEEGIIAVDERPLYLIPHGSALIECHILPFKEKECIICNRSYVVYGPRFDESLYKFLLNENAKLTFGAFGVDSDGDIVYDHAIYGNTCDKEDLRASAIAVTVMADKYDDEIKARWGGKTTADRVNEGR